VEGLRGAIPGRILAFLAFTTILLLPLTAQAQVNVSVGNRLEASWDEPTEATRVDDWLNTFFSGSSWEVAARLRVAQAIGSDTPDSVSLDQRSFSLHGGGLEVTAGTFYEQIGRGLIFRAFEQRFVSVGRTSRAFNVDRDVDGVRVGASIPWLEFVAFSGKPTITPPNGVLSGGGPLVGQKVDVVQTISGNIYALDNALQLGGSVLGAERTSIQAPSDDKPPTQTLRSARGKFQTPWGTFYTEWGDKRWHGRDRPYGRGLYSELSLNGGMWAGSLEYKNYQDFSFIYQDLPTLVRTQQSVLLNRVTHVQKPQDEEGFQLEIVRAPTPWVNTTLNVSGSWNEELLGRAVNFRYREAYLEHRNEGNIWDWLVFADWAEDTFNGDKNRWTGGVNFQYLFPPESIHAVLTDLELQSVETDDGETFTNAFTQIGASRAGRATVSLQYQWTTRKNDFGDRTEWLAGTFDLQFARAHSVFIFAGARPAGLLCSGGFCTFTPEFEGVEVRLLSAF
jgi:hypothetical protein